MNADARRILVTLAVGIGGRFSIKGACRVVFQNGTDKIDTDRAKHQLCMRQRAAKVCQRRDACVRNPGCCNRPRGPEI